MGGTAAAPETNPLWDYAVAFKENGNSIDAGRKKFGDLIHHIYQGYEAESHESSGAANVSHQLADCIRSLLFHLNISKFRKAYQHGCDFYVRR